MKVKKSERKLQKFLTCVKCARIRSYSGPFLPTLRLNTDQDKSDTGTFYAVPQSSIRIEIRRDARQNDRIKL